jgi:hypothetical protein
MSKSDKFIEDYYRVPRGGYPDSQSPQSHRGGSDDTEAFRGNRTVSMSDRRIGKTDDANPEAWDNLDTLDIEKHNPG